MAVVFDAIEGVFSNINAALRGRGASVYEYSRASRGDGRDASLLAS
jgi:hypothetical protein